MPRVVIRIGWNGPNWIIVDPENNLEECPDPIYYYHNTGIHPDVPHEECPNNPITCINATVPGSQTDGDALMLNENE